MPARPAPATRSTSPESAQRFASVPVVARAPNTAAGDADATVNVPCATADEVCPVSTRVCSPAGVADGTTNCALTTPSLSATNVPTSTGSECSTALTVSPGVKPPAVAVCAAPGATSPEPNVTGAAAGVAPFPLPFPFPFPLPLPFPFPFPLPFPLPLPLPGVVGVAVGVGSPVGSVVGVGVGDAVGVGVMLGFGTPRMSPLTHLRPSGMLGFCAAKSRG